MNKTLKFIFGIIVKYLNLNTLLLLGFYCILVIYFAIYGHMNGDVLQGSNLKHYIWGTVVMVAYFSYALIIIRLVLLKNKLNNIQIFLYVIISFLINSFILFILGIENNIFILFVILNLYILICHFISGLDKIILKATYIRDIGNWSIIFNIIALLIVFFINSYLYGFI